MRSPLIITNHASMRMFENRLDEKRLQQLWQCSRRCKDSLYRNQDKYMKYGTEQCNIEYYWAGGYLFTVDTRKNVLVTLTPKSSQKVKF